MAAYTADGIDAKGYVCDVTNEEMVQEMVKKIEAEVGVIDILVNNAGIIKRIPMCEMTAAEFRQVIDVDLNAPFIVSKAVIPSMIERGHGKIINGPQTAEGNTESGYFESCHISLPPFQLPFLQSVFPSVR